MKPKNLMQMTKRLPEVAISNGNTTVGIAFCATGATWHLTSVTSTRTQCREIQPTALAIFAVTEIHKLHLAPEENVPRRSSQNAWWNSMMVLESTTLKAFKQDGSRIVISTRCPLSLHKPSKPSVLNHICFWRIEDETVTTPALYKATAS